MPAKSASADIALNPLKGSLLIEALINDLAAARLLFPLSVRLSAGMVRELPVISSLNSLFLRLCELIDQLVEFR